MNSAAKRVAQQFEALGNCDERVFAPRRQDPEFHDRALQWGGGFIVGGHNYGQGSSREHAALAPLYLGIKAVIAKSFARIHRRNLISQGILPLVFAEEAGYDEAEQGDEWKIEGVRRAVTTGKTRLSASTGSGGDVPLEARLLPREREVLLAGGTLKHLQDEQAGTLVLRVKGLDPAIDRPAGRE